MKPANKMKKTLLFLFTLISLSAFAQVPDPNSVVSGKVYAFEIKGIRDTASFPWKVSDTIKLCTLRMPDGSFFYGVSQVAIDTVNKIATINFVRNSIDSAFSNLDTAYLRQVAVYTDDRGNLNVRLGDFTMPNYDPDSATLNIAIGVGALNGLTTGSGNTVVGYSALSLLDTGKSNTAIGMNAGATAKGDSNVLIGAGAGYSETGSNILHIANRIDRSLISGNFKDQYVVIRNKLFVDTFSTTPLKVTAEAALFLKNAGKLYPGQIYEVTNAGASRGFRGSVFVQAISEKSTSLYGIKKTPTDMNNPYAGLDFTGWGPTDSLKAIRVDGIDYLNDTILFTTDLVTSVTAVAAAINANPNSNVIAYVNTPPDKGTLIPKLILKWKYVNDSANGYVITISANAGITTAFVDVFASGHDLDTIYLDCEYDLDNDNIIYLRDRTINCSIRKEGQNNPGQNQWSMANFPWGRTEWELDDVHLANVRLDSTGVFFARRLQNNSLNHLDMDMEFEMTKCYVDTVIMQQSLGYNSSIIIRNTNAKGRIGANGQTLGSDANVTIDSCNIRTPGQLTTFQGITSFHGGFYMKKCRVLGAVNISNDFTGNGFFNATNQKGSVNVYNSTLSANGFNIRTNTFANAGTLSILNTDFTQVFTFDNCTVDGGGLIFDGVVSGASGTTIQNYTFANDAKGFVISGDTLPAGTFKGGRISRSEVRGEFTNTSAFNGAAGRGLSESTIAISNVQNILIPKNCIIKKITIIARNLTSSGAATLRIGLVGVNDSILKGRTLITSLNGMGYSFEPTPFASTKFTCVSITPGTANITGGFIRIIFEGIIADDTITQIATAVSPIDGTVTSISASSPVFNVGGVPITDAGTITIDWNNNPPRRLFFGGVNGRPQTSASLFYDSSLGKLRTSAYSFASDSLCYFQMNGTNIISAYTNDTERLRVTSNGGRTINGSGSVPSWSFINQTGAGLFTAATNQLCFSSGGAEAMRLDASMRLVIGGTSASFRLDVRGTAGVTETPTASATDSLIAKASTGQLVALARATGTYTPTLTGVNNVGASTAYQCRYERTGNTVTVYGKIDVDPTLTATSTQIGISLPIASNLAADQDCAGTAFCPAVAGQGAAILGDTTNDRAQMQWLAGDITNQTMFFTFTYIIL